MPNRARAAAVAAAGGDGASAGGGGGGGALMRVPLSLMMLASAVGVLLVFLVLHQAGWSGECVPGVAGCRPQLGSSSPPHAIALHPPRVLVAAVPPPPPPQSQPQPQPSSDSSSTMPDAMPTAASSAAAAAAGGANARLRGPGGGAGGKDKRKRLFFTVTAGHSGTAWLAQIMECTLARMRSVHEDAPSMVQFPELLARGRNATYETRRSEKLPALRKTLTSMRPGASYSDADHMFVKSWGDVALDWLEEVDPRGEQYDVTIVVMRRGIPPLLRSLLTVREPWDITQTVGMFVSGMYTQFDTNFALLPALGNRMAASRADTAMGYIADLELQLDAMRARYPRFRYVDVRSEQLLEEEGAISFLEALGLGPVDRRCLANVRNANKRHGHVDEAPPGTVAPLEVYLAHALAFQAKYAAAGITLHLPHLSPAEPAGESLLWGNGPLLTMDPDRVAALVAKYPMPPLQD